jgi:6-phosphofructokinase 2
MHSIVTLTMNPAVDLASDTPRFEPGRKTRCTRPRRSAGGGGINVARSIGVLGGKVLAVYPSGGPSGEQLDELLAEEGIETHRVPIDGDIRQNLSVAEQASERVHHLVFPGPELTEAEWRGCADAVADIDPAPAYVVLSGSLPPGVPEGFYADLARRCSARGSRVVLDTTGKPLRAALDDRAPLYLVKPNRKEFQQLFDVDPKDPGDCLPGMQQLIEDAAIDAVVVTLGEQGALLVTAERRLHLRPPAIEGRAPVGAGDSFVGAMVQRLADGGNLSEAARDGVAAAAAAVSLRDRQLFRPEDLEALRPQIDAVHLGDG